MEEGKSAANLEPEAGPTTSAVAVDAVAEARKQRRGMRKLEKSIQALALNGSVKDTTTKEGQILKLEAKRKDLSAEERKERRAAWIAESRKEVLRRTERRQVREIPDFHEKRKTSFQAVFPLINRKHELKLDEILHLRSVCQEWNKGIDNYIQNRFFTKRFNLFPTKQLQFYPELDAAIDNMEQRFRLEDRNVWNFLELNEDTPPRNGNPILSRKLRVGCICPHNFQENTCFWSSVGSLLRKFGWELWVLSVRLSKVPNFDSSGLYTALNCMLKLTPKLRELTIQAMEQQEDTPEMHKAMGEVPLPEMHYLSILNVHCIPPQMLKAMLNKYRTTLTAVFIQMNNMGGELIADIKLPKLKTLSVEANYFSMVEPKLKLSFPVIEEFTLQIHKGVDTTLITKIFRSLEQLGPTLRKLNLTLQNTNEPTGFDAAGLKSLSLDLPHLESFSLIMDMDQANLKTIDYILPMAALKYLNLTYIKAIPAWVKSRRTGDTGNGRIEAGPFGDGVAAAADAAPSEEIIKFWNHTWSLESSNIWGLFPELRKVLLNAVLITKLPQSIPNLEGVLPAQECRVDVYNRKGPFGKEVPSRNSYIFKF